MLSVMVQLLIVAVTEVETWIAAPFDSVVPPVVWLLLIMQRSMVGAAAGAR